MQFQIQVCKYCQCDFTPKHKTAQFCSKVCSNKGVIRRKKKIKKCYHLTCNNDVIYHSFKYCNECISIGRHRMKKTNGKVLSELTILDYCGSKRGANRYDGVRGRARKSLGDLSNAKCTYCGWKYHVEVCHKQPISSFSDDTLVSVVNDKSNLILLCPNCHWLFDNRPDVIKKMVGLAGSAPTTLEL